MKQYCRYCANCTCEEICVIKNRSVNAKSVNKCKEFEFCEMDALMSQDRDGEIHCYRPREKREKECAGQLKLFGKKPEEEQG